MAARNFENKNKIVILGGGIAGLACAQTLRQNAFDGEIVIISEENLLYDRTVLSKAIPSENPSHLNLRTYEFLKENEILFIGNSKVTVLNEKERKLKLSNGHIFVIIFLY